MYLPVQMRRAKLALLLGVLLAFAGLNLLAVHHAWAMTHFVRGAVRTPPPERLTRWERWGTLLKGVSLPRPENRQAPTDLGLPFAHRTVTVSGGLELEVWHLPAPDPESRNLAVLFHGYGASKASLLPVARLWRELGFGTLLVDFRGSGGSDGATTTLGYREAEDVLAAVGFAQETLRPARLILHGHSMGAVAILRAAAQRPVWAVDGVILESPFDSLLHTVRQRFAAMQVPAFPAAELLVLWGGALHGFNGLAFEPAKDARALRVPALLLGGDLDPRVPRDALARVQREIRSGVLLRVFPGVGHEPLAPAQPETWRATVTTFLKTLTAPAAAAETAPHAIR